MGRYNQAHIAEETLQRPSRRDSRSRVAVAERPEGDDADAYADADAGADSAAGGLSVRSSTEEQDHDVAVIEDREEPTALDTPTLGRVLQELEHGREVKEEILKLVEESKEFADYEDETDFEMSLLRLRYANAKSPMTPARRSQMSAHLHQVQLGLMEEHADQAADKFLASLSKEEVAYLDKMFGKLDQADVPLEPAPVRSGSFDRVASAFLGMCKKVVGIDPGSAPEEADRQSTSQPSGAEATYSAREGDGESAGQLPADSDEANDPSGSKGGSL